MLTAQDTPMLPLSPRRRFSARSALLLALFAPSPILAATFPADTDWIALAQDGQDMGDITGDGQNNGREIVGDTTDAAVFVYVDGTDFFFRLRLDNDPLQSATHLRAYGWGPCERT